MSHTVNADGLRKVAQMMDELALSEEDGVSVLICSPTVTVNDVQIGTLHHEDGEIVLYVGGQ